jgi:hypothetical protein
MVNPAALSNEVCTKDLREILFGFLSFMVNNFWMDNYAFKDNKIKRNNSHFVYRSNNVLYRKDRILSGTFKNLYRIFKNSFIPDVFPAQKLLCVAAFSLVINVKF